MNALWELTYVNIYVRTLLAAIHVTVILATSWIEMAAHAMVNSKHTNIIKFMYPIF